MPSNRSFPALQSFSFHFTITRDFSIGNYHLKWDIQESGGESSSGTHSITINPQKISATAYSQLLEDLETRLPASLAMALQSTGGLGGVHFLPPSQSTLAQEWNRLERAARGHNTRPGLIEVLRALADDPHRILATREIWMPTQRARRPLPSRLGLAVARPSNVQFVTKGDNEYSRPWRLHRVVDARVEETFDVYENRVVKGFCDQVQRRLRRLIARLKQTPGYSQTAHSAETLARELNDARRAAAFLDEVTPLNHSPERLTMLLLKRPPYRAALEGLIELQRSVAVRLQDSTLDAPLENLPHLYQVWSTLQVVQSLIETTQNAGYVLKLQRLFRRDAGGFFLELVPNGQPLVTLFHPVKQTQISQVLKSYLIQE